MQREGSFYEFNNGWLNELTNIDTYQPADVHSHFLIFAQDRKEAFKLAMSHIYSRYPATDMLNVDYQGHHYDVVKNVVTTLL